MAKTNNYSSWIFLGAAVVAGAGAFWLSHVYLKKQEEKLRSEVEAGNGEMVDVAVASTDLPAGSLVGGATMSVGRLPKAFVSSRFVTTNDFPTVDGHALVRAKSAGEPLLKDDVGGQFVERFSDLLKPGERAITIEASQVNSNSGLLLPGDHVDLYLVVKDTGGAGDSSTLVPLLEGVHVLAAGSEYLRAQDQKYLTMSEQNSHYDVITVAVTVDDAQKLILARKAGDISYALRNSADTALNVGSRLSSGALGVGGAAAALGSPDVGGSYEYFSASEPAGTIRQMNVPPAGAAAGLFGATGLSGAEPKQLMTLSQPAPDAAASANPATPSGGQPATGAGPAGTAAGTTGSTQAPATKTNGSKRE